MKVTRRGADQHLRIAVVANTAWYLANFRINLMRTLRSEGHELVGIAPEGKDAARLLQENFEFTAVNITGSGTNPVRELATVFALAREFRRQRVDLVLSYTPKGNLYSALACILTGREFIPNVSGLGRTFIQRNILTEVVKTLYRITFSRARRVLFQNQDDLDIFIRANLVPRSLAELIPGSGVDLKHFRFSPIEPRPLGRAVFILIARMLWDKGIGEYISAARVVKKAFPEARFQMLGFSGSDNPSAIPHEKICEWVSEGVVEYLGATDDVRPWLIQADCVVLPSYREGVPRSLLEAAAIGRPIITTDAPGCRNTVRDGVTGWLCRPANADDLVKRMTELILASHEVRSKMGMAGRNFVESNFDERVVIDRYVKLANMHRGR